MNYCPECGARLSAGAKFCPRCGHALGGQASGGSAANPTQGRWPWIAGAFAVVVVAVAAGVAMMQSTGAGGAGAPPPTEGPTDVLSLPPREQADRLFDRVMSLSEQGDTTQAAFFIPMAVQAHQRLSPLDPDARFHIGELELMRGGTAVALTQADSLEMEVPGHLFVFVLRGKAAERLGDQSAAEEAYRLFRTNEEEQLGLNRSEYEQHRFVLNQFRDRARSAAEGQ